jgi:hypothetical protein
MFYAPHGPASAIASIPVMDAPQWREEQCFPTYEYNKEFVGPTFRSDNEG